MSEPPVIEVREPGQPPRRVPVDRSIEIGRDTDGVVITDEGASRRHLKLLPSPLGLSVVDLGSRNGTLLNGVPLQGRVVLQPGDVMRLGRTEIVMVQGPATRGEPAAPRPPAFITSLKIPAPPARPVIVATPSRARIFGRAVFRGTEPPVDVPVFRNFLELPRRVPPQLWRAARVGSVLCYLTLCAAMFIVPTTGLFLFFGIVVPLLPILFFVAPGVWRNICPLAAANQTPRVFRFSKSLTPPEWLRRRGYLIAVLLFFGIAAARLVLFNNNAQATGVLLAAVILSAFAGGVAFKGKSGWCSSICPLLPLQRVYGQTPFVVVPNSHCQPCVACTKNCYDFKPQAAYQADLHDSDPHWSAPRKLFVSALPGFVLGFFTLVTAAAGTPPLMLYGELCLFVACSIAVFFVVEALTSLSPALLTALFGAAALNIFYFFAGPILAGSFRTVTGIGADWLRWPISLTVAGLSVVWISRSYWAEHRYLVENAPTRMLLPITPVSPFASGAVAAQSSSDDPEVRFLPEDKVVAGEVGMSLLEVAEREGLGIEAGCRMGVCGADPVAVVAGMDCLSAPEDEELTTLRRLGLAPSTRMACCARLQTGTVQVNLTPEPGNTSNADRPEKFDRSIASVVIIGNGIAGVTAADFIRRGHPDCEIHLIGTESHVLYNRMGISRLVYGRSAMTGLFLLDEKWYADKGVTAWLNTIATRIDTASRQVLLGTGQALAFDRLILATGGSGVRPPVEGFGAPGSFVLRSAQDAQEIRRYTQQQGCVYAVVAGGGLLGLEAAYALAELGLQVTILERGTRLLSKQIDERASELVHAHFDRAGITVRYLAESRTLTGDPVSANPPGVNPLGVNPASTDHAVQALTLSDGSTLPCQVFVACVGIRSNTELAVAAGISVNRGVLVDDRMQTSVPGVFAAGDVAEHDSLVLGLWPIAAKQGEVAAVNALGGDVDLTAEIPATILKGVGLELSSVGRLKPEDGDEVVVVQDARSGSYRRLIISNRVIVGALFLGHHPDDLAAATAAVKKRLALDAQSMSGLRAGNWQVLKPAPRAL